MKIIKRRTPETNAKLYSNSILAPMRKGIIKAWFRNVRLAQRFKMSPDEFFTMYFETCAHCMSHVEFCRYMTTNKDGFADTILNEWEGLEKC